MVTKKRKKIIKKKKLIVRTDAPIAIDYEHNENKTLEFLKGWGSVLFTVVVIMSIFSGFKYPWKWIDALYETEKEKLEIIENNWKYAYTPLIKWCSKNTFVKGKSNLYDSTKNKSAGKNYVISLAGDNKRCLEDKDFRIELINKPKSKTKENKILNKWFNEISLNVKDFNFEIGNASNHKTEQFIIKTNLFYWSEIFNIDDSDLDLSDSNQIICAYPGNTIFETGKIYELINNCSKTYYGDNDNSDPTARHFSIDFLSKEDFILLSKGCFNGCLSSIVYIESTGKNLIRGLKIIKPNLKTWPKYSNKDNKKIAEYDSMINKTYFRVNELEKHHLKPNWLVSIEIK